MFPVSNYTDDREPRRCIRQTYHSDFLPEGIACGKILPCKRLVHNCHRYSIQLFARIEDAPLYDRCAEQCEDSRADGCAQNVIPWIAEGAPPDIEGVIS